jgi:hypothetical protein
MNSTVTMPQCHPRFDYVESIVGLVVSVQCHSDSARELMRSLQFKRRWPSTRWTQKFNSEDDLTDALTALRDGGVLFAGGPSGWPPSAIFAHYRERGLCEGSVREIVWTSPHDQPAISLR